ncbi:hypothetical protein [Specibacter cremeus]|uniref:hypothetical protein n=1 Tax=Specibacter cremeus TaxID=1629051 RepID=UPI000F7A81EC|nr:hypothetical protein [Specibacter cremeus]
MKPRRLVIVGLVLAALIAGVAVVLNLLPPSPATEQAASGRTGTPGAVSSPARQSGSATAPAGATGGPASSVPKSTAPTNPKAPAATPDPGKPLEVRTPAPSGAPTLPASRTDGPLISLPLPATASATGKLVAGYPGKVLPPVPSSAITNSSVSAQQSTLQATLVATTSTEPLAVLAFYQSELAQLGLSASDAPAVPGSTARWFTRGDDKVTVTVTPVKGGGSSYIVYGVLHAGK